MELDMKQVLKPDQRERLMRLREEGRQRAMERRRRYRDGDPDARPPARRREPRPQPVSPRSLPQLAQPSRKRSSVHGSPRMWYPFSSQNPARSSARSSNPLAHFAPFQK